MPQSRTVTLLFTDLVNSTEHLQRAGDESGQLLFRAHHKLMTDAVTAAGGQELQWLGDGVLAVFESTADAVRCAISIQQTARRPVAGARFDIRIGINAGEVLRREGGYFGTPIVLGRRLCDRAAAGQILCSRLIADLLSARQTFSFRDLGPLELKSFAVPVSVCEVVYENDDPAAMLQRTPFVGRAHQMSRLAAKLEAACNGQGSIVMLVGEPGIGKTRMLEEFADLARQRGARVMRGACYDGEWQPPYGPFAEFIVDYAGRAETAELKAVLGNSAPTLARIAPSLHRQLNDIPEPATLDKDEERFRLLDAVSQFLITLSRQAPLVLVFDDLHWADRGTVGMLNHVAHFAGANPILLIAVYRDAEVGQTHPLSRAVAAMRRLPNTEQIQLRGLDAEEVAALLGMIANQDAPDALVMAIGGETGGNPFFIREVLLHLMEEGKIFRAGRQWVTTINVAELKIPEGVREVVNKRIGRLSDDVNRLLTVGAAFKGSFSFEVAAAVAELDESSALAAIDEALEAQLLRSGANADSLDFTHALIRHTLYSGMNSARRVRLHRKIAEAMEKTWGARIREHAAEIAYQFWRGASSSSGDRGVDYSIAAADQAEAAYAHDQALGFIRIALDLLPPGDSRRLALLPRLSLALAWTLDGDGACKVAHEASDLIAAAEGPVAATVYLEQVTRALYAAGLARDSWKLAREALRLAGDRRDVIWASLREIDLFREEAEDPGNPGIRVDSAGQREWRTLLRSLPAEQVKAHGFDPRYESRLEIVKETAPNPATLLLLAGDYTRSLPLWQKEAGDAESQGRIGWAITAWGNTASCYIALGELTAARASLERGALLAARASSSVSSRMLNLNLLSAQHELRLATDEGWEALLENAGSMDVLNKPSPENNWAFAMIRACGAYFFARINQTDVALEWIGTLTEAFERGASWEPTYSAVVCEAAAALWMLNRSETAEVVERNIRDKIIPPDFRYPMRDGRLSLARLCAVQHRYDEAVDWFAKAREVLDDQGARPLRALTDYDEGVMYIRRASSGDLDRAKPLLESARDQFRKIGMNGWLLRADEAVAQASRS
jgi:class 3 adenylate cyclase/tetratricopeptide (TPR) repeat protein